MFYFVNYIFTLLRILSFELFLLSFQNENYTDISNVSVTSIAFVFSLNFQHNQQFLEIRSFKWGLFMSDIK